MNKILATKNAERKELRARIQRLEQQLEEKDAVCCSGGKVYQALGVFFLTS